MQICKYMKSKDYEDKKELMEKLSVESRSVKELAKVVDRDVKTAVYIKEQHLKIDVEEVIKSLIYAISNLYIKEINSGRGLPARAPQVPRAGAHQLRQDAGAVGGGPPRRHRLQVQLIYDISTIEK